MNIKQIKLNNESKVLTHIKERGYLRYHTADYSMPWLNAVDRLTAKHILVYSKKENGYVIA